MLALAQNWWVPMIRGVAAIAFGVLAIVWPGLALMTMVALFGTFALVDGIVALAGLVSPKTRETQWFLQLVVGLAGLAAGIATFVYPGMTTVVLLSFIAAYAVVVGIVHVVAAVQQRDKPGAVPLGIGGVASTLLGAIMLANPAVGAVAVAWLIGIFAIAVGSALVAMGFALRSARGEAQRLVATMLPETERAKTKT